MNTNNMAMQALLGRLQRTNPQGYNLFMQFKNSGKSPDMIINEMLNSGMVTRSQVEQAQQLAGQYQQTNMQNIQKNNYKKF